MVNKLSLGLSETMRLIRFGNGLPQAVTELDLTAAESILKLACGQPGTCCFQIGDQRYRLEKVEGLEKDRWNFFCNGVYVFGLQESFRKYDYLISYCDYTPGWVQNIQKLM